MSKKAVVIVEGNTNQTERLVHELTKLVSEANQQPELTASLQTESVETTDDEVAFTTGGEHGHDRAAE